MSNPGDRALLLGGVLLFLWGGVRPDGAIMYIPSGNNGPLAGIDHLREGRRDGVLLGRRAPARGGTARSVQDDRAVGGPAPGQAAGALDARSRPDRCGTSLL